MNRDIFFFLLVRLVGWKVAGGKSRNMHKCELYIQSDNVQMYNVISTPKKREWPT